MSARGCHGRAARFAITALTGLCVTAASQATPPATLRLGGEGPYHRLDLPMAWQVLSKRGDLGDLHIVGAAQQSLPYAWVDLPDPVAFEQSSDLPLFRWAGPRANNRPATSTGSASSPSSSTWPVWVLDARGIDGRLQRLVLHLPSQAQGIYAVAVESSNDLQHWFTVHDVVQLTSLSHQGQRLQNEVVELGGVSARYVRLRLLPGSPEPTLSRATLVSSQTAQPMPAWSWSGRISPTGCGAGYCDYTVPANVPLGRMKVHLVQANTVWGVTVSGQPSTRDEQSATHPSQRADRSLRERLRTVREKCREHGTAGRQPDRHAGWFWVGDGQVHWLQQAGQISRSDELMLNHGMYRSLRLSMVGADERWTASPPDIQVATWMRSLVFLARGPGPYRLSWAASNAAPAALTMAQLVPDTAGRGLAEPGRAFLPDPAPQVPPMTGVTAAQRDKAQPSSDTWGGVPAVWWLWAALLLGLGLLAYMARGVLSGPTNGPK
jgi:hypothetical protein